MTGPGVTRLVVFSDDFGRHPSSSQHLIRELLLRTRRCCGSGCGGCETYRVTWVNTVGTRTPGLNWADFSRGVGKVKGWIGGVSGGADTVSSKTPAKAAAAMTGLLGGGWLEGHLDVLNPVMWPGFRQGWQRRLNAGSVAATVSKALGVRVPGERRFVLTTLPITADLVGRLDVDRWVYYCVDDFSVWPGLDSAVMQGMERELVAKVDDVVAVSQTLRDRIAGMGREAQLLTHGIDLGHWAGTLSRERLVESGRVPDWWPKAGGPVALFWGLIDQRLDTQWCKALTDELSKVNGSLILAGPEQNTDAALRGLKNTVFPGPMSFDDLPELAALADVLVMPYVDAPVTRAMQPLKLKEYLATDRPVVVRDLPATAGWSDGCDVVGDVHEFVAVCLGRAQSGLTEDQRVARNARLKAESWSAKAAELTRTWADVTDQLSDRSAA